MVLPKMIIFDYVHTLVYEREIDVCKGMQAVLEHAHTNPYHVTAEELTAFSGVMFDQVRLEKYKCQLEIHNWSYQNYVYDYFGLGFSLSNEALEEVFEEAASFNEPTPGIFELLDFLQNHHIEVAIVSNMVFSGALLNKRIKRLFPEYDFKFVIASSEYLFRKPDKRLFDLAVRKSRYKADEIYYCGDHVINDVHGSYQAGLKPIWYQGSKGFVKTESPTCDHLVIKHWSDLQTLLEEIYEQNKPKTNQ